MFQTAESQPLANKRKQITDVTPQNIICSEATQINCQIVTDVMVDDLGQIDVHDALFTAACLLPFVFMLSLKQWVCQFKGPKTECVFRQASVAHKPIVSRWAGENCQIKHLETVEEMKYCNNSLWNSLAYPTHSMMSGNKVILNSFQDLFFMNVYVFMCNITPFCSIYIK